MARISTLVDQLLTQVGDLWLLALIGSFFVMICEAAKPKPADGERQAAPQGLALLAMIMSLLTPLLLFLHAFATGSGALIAIMAAIGTVIIGSAIIGGLIKAVSPQVGRTLSSAAPVLAAPVFALTVYVTWASVADLANFVVGMFVR